MTDKELLELAAKAAGVGLSWTKADDYGGPFNVDDRNLPVWNPITNDGDALRLAVKLRLFEDLAWEQRNGLYTLADPYAATRRAIVRAAANVVRCL